MPEIAELRPRQCLTLADWHECDKVGWAMSSFKGRRASLGKGGRQATSGPGVLWRRPSRALVSELLSPEPLTLDAPGKDVSTSVA